MKKTVLRVQSGTLRGRGIASPPDDAVRPTSARVKEALFNILRPRLAGSSFLDLFCGTGQMGLEALSNGAAVLFADVDVRLAKQNVLPLCPDALFIQGDFRTVLGTLARRGQTFDILFADPPYRAGLYEEIAALALPLLSPGGLLVLEHATDTPLTGLPAQALCRRYGSRSLTFIGDNA